MGFFNWFSNKKEEKTSKAMPTQLDLEQKYQEVIAALEKHKRTAYLPVLKDNTKTFSTNSKYGGYPYLRNENDWPICENCKKHMPLFLQLNLNELPIKKEDGLIQLFYCTNYDEDCESELEAFFPFSKGSACRKIKIENPSATIQPNSIDIFDEKLIVDWNAKNDYPHPEEYSLRNVDATIDIDDVYELMEERDCGLTISQDKLFGWPYWIQSEEYPYDRKTETRMELLYQMGESEIIPYMFGDLGIGHLTQSPDNDEELAFGWACS
ncbi:hypothetical protein GCM10022389_00250 [Flavobacterium cheonanense]|uniref:DUF1963 domain-containing protein n=1 Tax=Flavobacterium cheonanense TaxID=706183 RepID=A0ABP7V5F8_9FLAO